MKRSLHSYAALLLAGAATFAVAPPAFAQANRQDARDAKIDALEKAVQDLVGEIKQLKEERAAEKEQQEALTVQVQDLKRSTATQYADVQNQRASDVKVTINNARPTFASADGRFQVSLRALAQFDAAYYAKGAHGPSATDLSSGTNFRRARIGLDGKAFGDWSFSFLYDLGGSAIEGAGLSDAYIQYDGWAPFHIRTGAFATPSGIEDQTSAGDLIFLERAAPVDLARGIAASDGRQNFLNVYAYGDDYYASIAYSGASTGTTNPTGATGTFFDEQQAIVGRVAYRVYNDADSNILASFNDTYLTKVADTAIANTSNLNLQTRPEVSVDTTNSRLVSTGNINANGYNQWGAEAAANYQNFYAQGGYYSYTVNRRLATPAQDAAGDPNFHGWYVQGSWIVTGERRRYNPATASWQTPQPTNPIDLNTTGWGAWELAARYDVIDLDYKPWLTSANGGIRGGRQEGWTVGVNWYPNNVIRFLFDFQHENIDRLNASGVQIGQKVNIVSARAQLAL